MSERDEKEISREVCELKHLDVDRRINNLNTLLYTILGFCIANPIIIAIVLNMMEKE